MPIFIKLSFLIIPHSIWAYNILLATMGGTVSHTVPFVALGTALADKGHNVTLFSGFTGPADNNGLREFVLSMLQVSRQLVLILASYYYSCSNLAANIFYCCCLKFRKLITNKVKRNLNVFLGINFYVIFFF